MKKPSQHRRARHLQHLHHLLPAVAAAALTLSLAACGDSSDGSGSFGGLGSPDGSDESGDSGSPDDSGDKAAPSHSDTSQSPSPPASPAPTAEDGTNTDACSDGRCEVAVSEPTGIPLDGQLGVTLVEVQDIGQDGVGVACNWEFQEADSSGSSAGAVASVLSLGSVLPCNDLELRLTDITDGTAILGFSPA